MPTSKHTIDQDYLLELIAHFPVDTHNPIDLKVAKRKIQLRHDRLSWENRDTLLKIFPKEVFFFHLQQLPKLLHTILFKDILSNAGKYRSAEEPNGGLVRFGPNRRYEGTHPRYIQKRTEEALNLLTPDHRDPIYNAIKFYQHFVYFHPFYDANGRIGRFIVSLYLNYHNLLIDWEHLERNEKWLKKLNACHDRMQADKPVYERHLRFMVNHWQKSINTFQENEVQ